MEGRSNCGQCSRPKCRLSRKRAIVTPEAHEKEVKKEERDAFVQSPGRIK